MTDYAHRGLWSAYDDGVVCGTLLHRLLPCDVCGHLTACVEVAMYGERLDEFWRTTIIYLSPRHEIDRAASRLGLGCGCLAKLHRQVVHIEEA